MSRTRRPRIIRKQPRTGLPGAGRGKHNSQAAAALATFGAIACLNEPTVADWRVHAWAGRVYRRSIEVAQAPLELLGLPGAYIPVTVLASRRLPGRGPNGARARATIVGAAVAGWLTVRLTRLLIFRPRPPDPPRRRNDKESTFPSGHTTGVTTLITVATSVLRDEKILTSRQAMALRAGVPLLFALTRIYLREHWLTDVLGGLALGTAVGEGILAAAWSDTSAT